MPVACEAFRQQVWRCVYRIDPRPHNENAPTLRPPPQPIAARLSVSVPSLSRVAITVRRANECPDQTTQDRIDFCPARRRVTPACSIVCSLYGNMGGRQTPTVLPQPAALQPAPNDKPFSVCSANESVTPPILKWAILSNVALWQI